jgi:hypothetical protein
MTGRILAENARYCKVFLADGWKTVWRVWVLWAIVALGVLFSALVLSLRLPFSDRTSALMASYSALDQFMTLLAVLCWMVTYRRWGRPLTWPVPRGLLSFARCLGISLGVSAGVGILAVSQLIITCLGPGISIALDSLQPYALMVLSAWLYSFVLAVWGSVFLDHIRPLTSAFLTMVLVLTGFMVSGFFERFPSLTPLLVLLPDLGSIAPVSFLKLSPDEIVLRTAYGLIHSASVCVLGALLSPVHSKCAGSIDGLARRA